MDLLEDLVHYVRYQNDLGVWNRHGTVVLNRTIKRFDQIPHSRVHVEVSLQKQRQISAPVTQLLDRRLYRRNKEIGVAFELRTTNLKQDLVILIQNKTVLMSVDSELLQHRLDLRRKGEIGCCAV